MKHGPTSYDLFKRGYDTVEIAKYFGISEAAALKSLTTERSAALNKPVNFENTSTPWPSGQVAYAGR